MAERPPEFDIYPQHQLAQGLVFAGLGRHVGSRYFHDSSLFGNHGTLTNMDPSTDWIRTLGRSGITFAGGGELVSVGAAMQKFLSGATQLTVAGWSIWDAAHNLNYAKLLSNEYTDRFIVGQTGTGSDNRISLGLNAAYRGNSITLSTTAWTHWAFVWDAVNVYSFTNGVSSAGAAYSTALSSVGNAFAIAGYSGYTTYGFQGSHADIMLWSRALSAAEISALADPSNVMLSLGGAGWGLLRYRRKWWPVGVGGAPPAVPYWIWAKQHKSQVIGGGIA